MTHKAALFDLDGVLIDTEPVYTRIWSDIERHFPTGVENFATVIKGSTLQGILNTYFNPADHQSIINMLRKAEDTMEYPLFPETIPFLEKLCEANIPSAIVTSSGDIKMKRLFEQQPQLGNMFDAIITDSDVIHGKPDPEGYMLGAKKLGFAPQKCVVFEDSFNGLKAGRAAGTFVIAVATTNTPESLAPMADLVVDKLDTNIIERFTGKII